MTVKQIFHYPHPMLATETDEVLAANQVGALFSMFVIKDHTKEDEYITCINPSILAVQDGEIDSTEGCLSFPGVQERIKRHTRVKVKYQEESGDVVERWFFDVSAVAFQHELDHLH